MIAVLRAQFQESVLRDHRPRHRPCSGEVGGISDKRPFMGMRPHTGAVSLPTREQVLQPTIRPSMPSTVAVGSLRSPDDADRFARCHTGGEAHRTVSPGRGKDAPEAEAEEVHAVPGHSRPRPPHGLAPETRPLDRGFCAWMYDLNTRGTTRGTSRLATGLT